MQTEGNDNLKKIVFLLLYSERSSQALCSITGCSENGAVFVREPKVLSLSCRVPFMDKAALVVPLTLQTHTHTGHSWLGVTHSLCVCVLPYFLFYV